MLINEIHGARTHTHSFTHNHACQETVAVVHLSNLLLHRICCSDLIFILNKSNNLIVQAVVTPDIPCTVKLSLCSKCSSNNFFKAEFKCCSIKESHIEWDHKYIIYFNGTNQRHTHVYCRCLCSSSFSSLCLEQTQRPKNCNNCEAEANYSTYTAPFSQLSLLFPYQATSECVTLIQYYSNLPQARREIVFQL